MRLVVLGKQGAGKGTQCARLSERFGVPHVSTGDMFRAVAKSDTELGKLVREKMAEGELIGDDLVLAIVNDRLEQDDARRGFVLDGFPRNVAQAEALASMLSPLELDGVLDIEVPSVVVVERLAARRVCANCGAIYSLSQPPKQDWICDVCGGSVIQREDDTEEAIRRRLELYERETAPLIEWYSARGKLFSVDGVGDPGEVELHVIDALRKNIPTLFSDV
jgi:Adenylate kinase (EC 2.7.4.3)